MRSQASISVVIPVYNRAHLLAETLNCLLRQSRPVDEIIVVDDGSTDRSAEIARSFGGSVRVLVTNNGGPGRARNIGLTKARGDFIQFMDSDDLPSRGFIESRINAIESFGGDVAYGPWIPAWINGRQVTVDGFLRQSQRTERPLDAFLQGWVLFIPNALIRRTLLEDVGGYPEGLFTGEDMLLLFNILRRTERLVHTENSLLLVRQHPDNQISSSPRFQLQRDWDEYHLTMRILHDLESNEHCPISVDPAAIKHWTRRARTAQSTVSKVGVTNTTESQKLPLSTADLMQAKLSTVVKRLKSKSRQIKWGHRIEPFFKPAPLSSFCIDEIRDLGFTIIHSKNPYHFGA